VLSAIRCGESQSVVWRNFLGNPGMMVLAVSTAARLKPLHGWRETGSRRGRKSFFLRNGKVLFRSAQTARRSAA